MSTTPGIPESTYRLCYRGEKSSQPYIRYRNLPCIQCPLDQPERQFRQIDECKLLAKNYRVSSGRQGRPKSSRRLISKKGVKVFDTKFGPMNMNEVTHLYNNRRYATSSQKAGKEFVLLPMHRPVPPPHTKEEKPDQIVLKGRKYEDSREEWQDAVLFDRIQSRAPTERPLTAAREKLLLNRQKALPLRPEVESEIESLVKTDGLANVFIKKCPRYAGYAPLCPPETRLNDKQRDVITSTMRASYRNFPEEEFMSQFARQGPLSKTVTLTAPYNPYNKVGDELQSGDKDGRYLRLFTGYTTSSYIH